MAEERKAPPAAENSLNNISWHLKRHNENMEKVITALEKICARMAGDGKEYDPGDF